MIGCLLFSGRHTSFGDYNLLYAAVAPAFQQKCGDDLGFVEIHIIL